MKAKVAKVGGRAQLGEEACLIGRSLSPSAPSEPQAPRWIWAHLQGWTSDCLVKETSFQTASYLRQRLCPLTNVEEFQCI